MELLNYNVEYGNFAIENKFKKIVFSNNKHKVTTIFRKNFLNNNSKKNVNAINLVSEFNKFDRLFVFKDNRKKVQPKIYKRAFLTFLNNNFLNYLFLNKIFQWFFFFIKQFDKKKVSKEGVDFFFSQLLLKNINFFFNYDFLMLSFSYNNFLKKYFHIFFLNSNGKKNWKSKKKFRYRKNKSYSLKNRFYAKNNKKTNFKLINTINNNTNIIDNNLYLKLFLFQKEKKLRVNLNNFTLKGIRFFFKRKRFWYYKLRFKKYWYIRKYLFYKRYIRRGKRMFFYVESYYKLCQKFDKVNFPKKFSFKPQTQYQLQLLYKHKLNFLFKKIKSNLSFFFNFFSKNNTIFFLDQEKKFLLSLESLNHQILLDYFYPRIFYYNYDFISTKN